MLSLHSESLKQKYLYLKNSKKMRKNLNAVVDVQGLTTQEVENEGLALCEAIVNNYLEVVAEDLKRSAYNLNTSTTEESKDMHLTMIRNGNNAIYELLGDYEDIDFEYVAENVQCYDGKTLYNFIRFYDKELHEGNEEEMLDPDFILKMVRKAYPKYNKEIA